MPSKVTHGNYRTHVHESLGAYLIVSIFTIKTPYEIYWHDDASDLLKFAQKNI